MATDPNDQQGKRCRLPESGCWKYDWVIDMDIKGFFDNIPHDLMMRAVRKHTQGTLGVALCGKMVKGIRSVKGWGD